MNMRATLTEDELMAQRAARTGRRVPPAPPAAAPVADPGVGRATLPQRSPFLASLGLDDPLNDTDTGDGAAVLPGAAPAVPPAPPAAPPAGGADLAALQQQLAAAIGRVAPMQQQVDQMRATIESLQTANAQLQAGNAELAAAQNAARARQAAEQFDPFASLSADDLAAVDPAVLRMMRTAAQAAIASTTANMQDPGVLIQQALQQRDARALKSYVTTKARELNLVALGNDTKFQQFLATDDSAEILLNSFVQAADLDAARFLEPKIRQMIKRYEKTQAAPGGTQDPDPSDRLTAHLSRSGTPSNPAQPGRRKELTPEMVKDIRARAARMQRQRDFKGAAELLAQLN